MKKCIPAGWRMLSRKLYRQVSEIEFNLLKPTGHVVHQRFKIQQLYVLPALY